MERFQRIAQRYDPDISEDIGRLWVERFAQYLRAASTGPAGTSYHSHTLEALADGFLAMGGSSSDLKAQAAALMEAYSLQARVLHSPRYMGHQVPPPLPLAGLMQGIALAFNQGLAVEEMGPFAAAIERALIKRLVSKVGFDLAKAHGIVTSGGTLANMTALLAARAKKQPEAWRQGNQGPLKIIVSEDAHYCMSRAMGVMGLGDQNCVKVRGRMTRESLAAVMAAEQREQILAVVASAPSTPAGLIDDLDDIATYCEQHQLWLHIDAVHGASLLFSSTYAERLHGIQRADSISWDAHKMLHVPSLATFLLYKDRKNAQGAFQQSAPYLFRDEAEQSSFDPALCTFECTKPSLLTGLWAVWSLYGEQAFADNIDQCMALTEAGYQLLATEKDFHVGPVPHTNILCWRWLPNKPLPAAEAGALQLKIRNILLAEGEFYITASVVEGVQYLRLTLINPMTTIEDLFALRDKVRTVGLSLTS